jgi:hypothetical protein
MRRRRTFADGLRAAALAACVLTGAAGPAAAAPLEPTPPERLYVRRPGPMIRAADAVISFAREVGAPLVRDVRSHDVRAASRRQRVPRRP